MPAGEDNPEALAREVKWEGAVFDAQAKSAILGAHDQHGWVEQMECILVIIADKGAAAHEQAMNGRIGGRRPGSAANRVMQ